ncbi:hypothetical protein HYH03_006538 [Edaphochlamys debaryana]|uniref:Protein SirB1 N-terminal domain-containing protein n=1 Tax=Edaphochlamys debaryana TaxID=47281 RepID=A0A836C024_9CHLO|nr:hypothetical protein HYH03_006538 [Edaphochlamys debaryana]|eukprot:KAG2495265.1 hypothetical protein HYH03_006538 [Edaphochlamys debaryana]
MIRAKLHGRPASGACISSCPRIPRPWPSPPPLAPKPASPAALSTSARMVVVRGGRGRHPELLGLQGSSQESENAGGSESTSGSGTSASAGSKVIEAPRPEDVDERYRRADFSDRFQYESRQAFARCLVGGEPRMALAEAALHASAEDDAIASLSSVPFPVGPWLDRIDRLVDQVCATHLPRAAAAAGGGGGGGGGIAAAAAAAASGPAAAGGGAEEGGGSEGLSTAAAAQAAGLVAAVERFLWEEAGFRMPDYGRSNLPPNARVDHAGVWEDARLGYLHETLVRRLGHPACLGLLLGEVCARLLERGRLPCAAAVDTRAFVLLPRAVPLPQLPREVVLSRRGPAQGPQGEQGQQGRLLNTTTSEVLVEMLRHLKRSFWPFAWDSAADPTGSHGGFRAAAKAAAGEEMSAALAAIGKVAAWRLERGIWTSPGAGDLRRCVASAERLVLLAGERCPEER